MPTYNPKCNKYHAVRMPDNFNEFMMDKQVRRTLCGLSIYNSNVHWGSINTFCKWKLDRFPRCKQCMKNPEVVMAFLADL
jgi:hypothetical protein